MATACQKTERIVSSAEGFTCLWTCTCGAEHSSGPRRTESDARAAGVTSFALHRNYGASFSPY
jgi:hypothetical protein